MSLDLWAHAVFSQVAGDVGPPAPSGPFLYMYEFNHNTLYRYDFSTGRLISVLVPSNIENIRGITYFEELGIGYFYFVAESIGGGRASQALYRMGSDKTITRVGRATSYGLSGNVRIDALARHNNLTYGVDGLGDYLCRINTANGTARRSPIKLATQIQPQGLASLGGILLLSSISPTRALYSVNTGSGIASIRHQLAGNPFIQAISTHDSKLYGYEGIKAGLFEINTSNNTVSQVTPSVAGFGVGATVVAAMTSAPVELEAIQLYMIGARDNLYSLNPDTGGATVVRSLQTSAGVSTDPAGIARHNGVTYFLANPDDSSSVNALFKIEGASITQIGSPGFGVSRFARGLVSLDNKLYTLLAGSLYTLNTTTGVATKVGTANNFNIGESQPQDLALHRKRLYMVGTSTAYLTTVNTTTGVATRVGTAFQFGINERLPGGIESLNGELYLVGSITKSLYTLNTTTGLATHVDPPLRAAKIAIDAHPGTLYMLDDKNPPWLHSVAADGESTFVAETDLPGPVTGMASVGGTTYVSSQRQLFSLNRTTGKATRIGTRTSDNYDRLSNVGGGANGKLYGVSDSFPTGLYELSITDGTERAIGRFDVNTAPQTIIDIGSGAGHGIIYVLGRRFGQFGNQLYSISPDNGRAGYSGAISGGVTRNRALVSIDLATINNSNQLVVCNDYELFGLNITTRATTSLGTFLETEQDSITNFGVNEQTPRGLAAW